MAHTIRTFTASSAPFGRSVLAALGTRLAVWRSRRALAALDAAALKDIGVTTLQAQREADLGFWDVPANWR